VSAVDQSQERVIVSYRRPMSLWWWLESCAYSKFILRECTSLFVGIFAVILLFQISAISDGPEEYAAFMERLATPGFILLNGAVLLFVLYHSITWLNLVPTIVVIRLGGRRVPDGIIAAAHYVLWLALSVTIAGILLLK